MITISGIAVAKWIVANPMVYREKMLGYGYENWQIDQYIQYAEEWVTTGVQPTWSLDTRPPSGEEGTPTDGVPIPPEVKTDWQKLAIIGGAAILAVVLIAVIVRRR